MDGAHVFHRTSVRLEVSTERSGALVTGFHERSSGALGAAKPGSYAAERPDPSAMS